MADLALSTPEALPHRRLKWAAILAPVVFLTLLEGFRMLSTGQFAGWRAQVVINLAVLIVSMAFYSIVFAAVDNHRRRQDRQIEELTALRDAGLDIASELRLDAVLGKVVDHARRLTESLYGAVSVVDESGQIETFVTSGIDRETRAKIGEPPRGHGLLGLVLREGQHLRLDDLSSDPRAGGFPEHHPAMRSLLAVPIVCRSPFRGNLYLSERADGAPFSAEDEALLVRFASQAAVAIDNADLHRRARALDVAKERVRIAHELHDGQAQVLASVNAKAQAVSHYLNDQRIEEARVQLDELATTARQIYADVRGDILGLRTAVDPSLGLAETLRQYVDQWRQAQTLEVSFHVDGAPRLAQDIELQILRILQEALANVRKHAEASRVEITLSAGEAGLELVVEDDGTGFRPDAIERRRIPRFGLATMRERAEAIGGQLAIESTPGLGTCLTLSFPNGGRPWADLTGRLVPAVLSSREASARATARGSHPAGPAR